MDALIFHSRRLQAIALRLLIYLVATLLVAGLPACIQFECHFADSNCNPLASILLTGNTVTACLDPNYSAPTGAIAVTSSADSGTGTLRQAITDVPTGGSIDLTNVDGSIVLASVLPAISKDIDFYGACGPTQIIDGANAFRMFRISGGATVSLFYLTLQNGNAPGGPGDLAPAGLAPAGGGGGVSMGGAIFIDGSSQVTISQTVFTGSHATGGAGAFGIDTAGAGSTAGKSGGGPAHDVPVGGAAPFCPGPAGAGGFGTGGAGGCSDTGVAGGLVGGAGGYGGGSGAGGSGSTSAAGGTPGLFGGTGATGCTGVTNNDSAGGGGGGGLGGAIAVHGAGTTLTISDSTFVNNTATGGAGGAAVSCNAGAAGQGKGGAIFVDAGGAVTQSNLTMTGNSATDQTAAANDNNNVYGFNFP